MNTLTFRPRPGTVDLWDIWTTWGDYCHKVATIPQNDVPAPIRLAGSYVDDDLDALWSRDPVLETRFR